MAYDPRNPRATDRGYDNPMAAGQRRSADQIEDDIEATRARIEARLEGLSRETSPGRLLESTLGADLSSPGDTIASLYARARSNPISAGLIGAGLLALYLGKRTEDPVAIARARREAERDTEVPGPATRDAAERLAYDIEALKGHARSVKDDVTSTAGRLSSSIGQTRDASVSGAGRTASGISDAVDDARSTVSHAASSLGERAREAYDSTSDRLAEVYEGASERLAHAPTYARERARYAGSWVQENPIAAGLIGLALGATAASIMATSRATAPRSRASATRDLYRAADGYSTAEELQRQAVRNTSAQPVTSTTGRAVRPEPATSSTRVEAVPAAANPARSSASQAARRAEATAMDTVGKSTAAAPKSTVAKTRTRKSAPKKSTKPKAPTVKD